MKTQSIWYSPEEDKIRLSTREDGYIFKDEFGEFHCWLSMDLYKAYKQVKYYYIGKL